MAAATETKATLMAEAAIGWQRKEKLRRETLCGRLDRTINHARAIKYHIQIC